MKYFKVYMQLEGDDSPVMETIADFGMYCMEDPFKVAEKVKEPFKRSWPELDGDDEYIPEDGLRLSSYENTVKFGFKGDAYDSNEHLISFLRFLKSGKIKMFSEFNNIGRQHVRLSEISDELHRDVDSGDDLLIMSIKLKFNDPTTEIKLSKDAGGKVIDLVPHERT